MVAWRVSMLTPQYPEGRDMIIIANDITNQIGSFGRARGGLIVPTGLSSQPGARNPETLHCCQQWGKDRPSRETQAAACT